MTVIYADAAANAMLDTLRVLGFYVSLHSADPGKTGASELAGDGYSRQEYQFPAAADQALTNDEIITFAGATAEWAQATHYGIWSAETEGTFIAGAALGAPVTVPNLGSASFAVGALILSLEELA